MVPSRESSSWLKILAYVRSGVSPESALALEGVVGRPARKLVAAAMGAAPAGRWRAHVADLQAALAFSRAKVETDLKASKPLAWLHYQRDLLDRCCRVHRQQQRSEPTFFHLLGELGEHWRHFPSCAAADYHSRIHTSFVRGSWSLVPGRQRGTIDRGQGTSNRGATSMSRQEFVNRHFHRLCGVMLDAALSRRSGSELSLSLRVWQREITDFLGRAYDELAPPPSSPVPGPSSPNIDNGRRPVVDATTFHG